MLHNHQSTNNSPSYAAPSSSDAASSQNNVVLPPKRKRRPAGTPDPDAEVVCLSPKTLLESDRYVCEICKLGFQREQNLQMHKRRHKVPWKLVKKERENSREEEEVVVVKKKVFVCPEPSCLHHHPSHALGDLVGIKKHFRRKHSNHKQWVCHKCSKAYAVHSDFKAHLKTCGTRGHSCDCGRVFSRVESFIEHQDACNKLSQPSCSRTASSTSPSSEPNFNIVAIPPLLLQGFPLPTRPPPPPPPPHKHTTIPQQLHLLRCSSFDNHNHESETHLKLSIGSSCSNSNGVVEAVEEVKLAMEEKANAEEARREAKREIEMAEFEFGKAKRLRKEAQEEVHKAQAFKNQTMVNISSTLLQITCQACKKHFQSSMLGLSSQETSMVMNDP